MKINELIPIIDDAINIYEKYHGVLESFGDTDTKSIISIVNTIKNLFGK